MASQSTFMEACSIEQVTATLSEIVKDLVQDWGVDLDGGISGRTLLVADLEFASVDIILLCVAVEQHYDTKFGFQDLLMNNGRYVSDLSITQMAAFLHGRMKGRTT